MKKIKELSKHLKDLIGNEILQEAKYGFSQSCECDTACTTCPWAGSHVIHGMDEAEIMHS